MVANERGVEWTINMVDGTSKILSPECSSGSRIWRKLHGFVTGLMSKIGGFFRRAWMIGVNEPRKVMHCVKVGVALSLVSLFYYMRPLYEGVGGTAMWAVMTVIVVFEYTVGAAICKCVNRATGTFLAAALGVGVHWIASFTGETFHPIIIQASVFLLAAAATFSRFIPSIKVRFDYGAMIFVLTFSLVSISGYRVEKLFDMVHHRLSTIAIGASICIITTMVFSPVWAGAELHNLITNNMDKLSGSLTGCVADFFGEACEKKTLQAYKCALNSKAAEESLANFARWEPAHGGFNFRHPWKEYVKVGASLRSCAYCIEALNGSIHTDAKKQVPEALKKHFSSFCMRVSANSSAVMKELATVIGTMEKSTKMDSMVEEMRRAVQDLKSLSKQPIQLGEAKSLVEVVPLVTASSLLIEIAARTEKLVGAVNVLAEKAEFQGKETHNSRGENRNVVGREDEDNKAMMTLQKV